MEISILKACVVHCYIFEKKIVHSKTFHFKLTPPFGNKKDVSINHVGETTVNSGFK